MYSNRALLAALACLTYSQAHSGSTVPVFSADSSQAKFVVFPGCVNSHWYQALAVIKQLSSRGHEVQVAT